MRSLSQFQALQDGENELAGLRELGLTDAEIELWQSRDESVAAEKVKPAENRRSWRHSGLIQTRLGVIDWKRYICL